MEARQRVVYTNGRSSHLISGDPEWDAERMFCDERGTRFGCALPVLMAEGWSIVSVTPLERRADESDDYGCALVVLVKVGPPAK